MEMPIQTAAETRAPSRAGVVGCLAPSEGMESGVRCTGLMPVASMCSDASIRRSRIQATVTSIGKSVLDMRTIECASESLDQRKVVATLARRMREYSAWSSVSALLDTQRLTWALRGPAQRSSWLDRECGSPGAKEKALVGRVPSKATSRIGRKGKTCWS